jgi:hypothetical protein
MDFDAQLTINKKQDNLFLRKQEVIIHIMLELSATTFYYYKSQF